MICHTDRTTSRKPTAFFLNLQLATNRKSFNKCCISFYVLNISRKKRCLLSIPAYESLIYSTLVLPGTKVSLIQNSYHHYFNKKIFSLTLSKSSFIPMAISSQMISLTLSNKKHFRWIVISSTCPTLCGQKQFVLKSVGKATKVGILN